MTTSVDTRTLTDRALAAEADRARHAAQAMGRPFRVDDDLVVARQGTRGMFTNLGYVLTEPKDWDDVLARVAAVVPLDAPVSLVAAVSVPDLAPLGWEVVGHPPLMVRPPGTPGESAPPELTVAEATDRAGLEAFERTLVDAFPETDLQPYRPGEVYDERVLGGPTRFFTGWLAGRPVATAAGHVAAGVNVVEMVSTAPPARGRGYGAALTEVTATLDPTLPAVLIASDPGRPVYERLGFMAVTRWTFWHRPASTAGSQG